MTASASTVCGRRMPAPDISWYSSTTSVWLSLPAVRNVSSNMATVRTRTRTDAARMPGTSRGARIRMKIDQVVAPHIRAAASIFGSICSMNGVIVSTTNGTDGTRFARITPVIVPARWYLYSTVASGMPYAIGGTRIGSRNARVTSCLPGKRRRAST